MATISKTVSVDVDVDIDVILDDFTDDQLAETLRFRGYFVTDDPPMLRLDPMCEHQDWRDLADDLRAAAHSGDRMHLAVLLVRLVTMAGAGYPAPAEERVRMPWLRRRIARENNSP